jgi:metacaspase-1
MKTALLVGINKYFDCPLRGCINDLRLVRENLTEYYGFEHQHISELRDKDATKSNIINKLQAMIGILQKGDTMLFHYSGHGSYIPDTNFDEDDKRDEILCVYEMDWDDPFVDDDLNNIYNSVPKGATLVVTMDCCHSGTNYRMAEMRNRFLPPPSYLWQQPRRMMRTPKVKIYFGQDTNVGDIISLCGCAADQTCADAFIDHDYYGAFTYYLSESIRENSGDITYVQLIERIKNKLKDNEYSQEPELYANDAELLNQKIFSL